MSERHPFGQRLDDLMEHLDAEHGWSMQDIALPEEPADILKEARRAVWEAQVALNHAVSYQLAGSAQQTERYLDQAQTWLRFADGRVAAAVAEMSGETRR